MNKILLITMLCLSMTACGGPSAGPETSEAAIASTPEIFAASTAEISEAESLIDTSNDTEKNHSAEVGLDDSPENHLEESAEASLEESTELTLQSTDQVKTSYSAGAVKSVTNSTSAEYTTVAESTASTESCPAVESTNAVETAPSTASPSHAECITVGGTTIAVITCPIQPSSGTEPSTESTQESTTESVPDSTSELPTDSVTDSPTDQAPGQAPEIPTESSPETTTPPSSSSQNSVSELEKEAFDMINEIRLENGLKALELDPELYECTNIRAEEASRYWSHTRPDGSSWYTVNPSIFHGENLAYGYKTASSVVDGWMNSTGHRENILNSRYTRGSLSLYKSDSNWYWCFGFGY